MCKKANGFRNYNGLPIPSKLMQKWCNVAKDKPETIGNEVNNLFLAMEKSEQKKVIFNDLHLLSKAK